MTQVSIEDAIRLAAQRLQSGRAADAERIYRKILSQHPKSINALYGLGMMALRAGHADAVGFLDQCVTLEPGFADAWNNLGVALQAKGDVARSIDCFERALSVRPEHSQAIGNLGAALHTAGRNDEAIGVLRRAIVRNPNHAQTYVALAGALSAQQRYGEAIDSYRRATEIQPELAEAWDGLGMMYKAKNRMAEALACFRRATEVKPTNAQGFTHMGHAFHSLGRFDEAIECYFRAVELSPDSYDAISNLAASLGQRGRVEESVEQSHRAIALRPNLGEAHANLGTGMLNLGRFDQAIDIFRHAIALDPNLARAHFNLALTLLSCGQFEEGWRQYEWRWKILTYLPGAPRNLSQPLWDGTAAAPGATILLYCEQGLGDTIQFVRFIPSVLQLGWKVVLGCQSSLLRLLGTQDWLAGVRLVEITPDGQMQTLPFDVQLPLASLPLVMKALDPHSPAWPRDPYLRADADRAESWRHELAAMDGLKIGICWAGSPNHSNDFNRSLPLSALAPLARPGARFFSFQFGPAAAQSAAPPPAMDLIDWTGRMEDFADSAAVVEQMDLIITVDTALAHLAGAMGKPVWVLLPFVPDFRWMLDRDDTPLYPNMRLFRQDRRMDWTGAIDRVAAALSDKCERP